MSKKLEKVTKRLRDQEYGIMTGGAKNNVQVAQPDPGTYGVYAPRYADAMSRRTDDPLFGGMHLAGLKMNAADEVDRYEAMLREAQEQQLLAQDAGIAGDLQGKLLDLTPTMLEYGVFGYNNIGRDAEGRPALQVDMPSAMQSNAYQFAGQAADIRKTNAEAGKSRYESGLQPDAVTEAQRDTMPFQAGPEPAYGMFDNRGYSPQDISRDTTAEAAEMNAVTNRMDMQADNALAQQSFAHRVRTGQTGGRGGAGGLKADVTYDERGKPVVKYRGSAEAIEALMARRAGSKKPVFPR